MHTSQTLAPPLTAEAGGIRSTGGIIVDATPSSIAARAGGHDPKIDLMELLAEVAAENKSAFARLYGLTNRKLFGVALRILGDRGLAEDVLQESYLKVWRNAASYDRAIASPMAWMATIVRHGAIDALRKRKLEATGTENDLLTLASDDPDPIDELDLARLRKLALAAFARLPEDKRRLIMLAYLGEQSRHELSIRLGVPANTLKTHLRRALLELRATMGSSAKAGSCRAA